MFIYLSMYKHTYTHTNTVDECIGGLCLMGKEVGESSVFDKFYRHKHGLSGNVKSDYVSMHHTYTIDEFIGGPSLLGEVRESSECDYFMDTFMPCWRT